MNTPTMTAVRLRELLDYDRETGIFSWKVNRGPARIGGHAGSIDAHGYNIIYLDGKSYKSHRLAWLYVHDKFPDNDIDHINGNRLDNRLVNIRDVPRSMNTQNQRRPQVSNRTSGLLGVSANWNKWEARIHCQKKLVYLGLFSTKEEAHEAYLKAKRERHPGNTL